LPGIPLASVKSFNIDNVSSSFATYLAPLIMYIRPSLYLKKL
jgi:hypothetical protein